MMISWATLRSSAGAAFAALGVFAATAPSAASNVLVLYHSTSVGGRDIAVSGTVAIPKGTPTAGGWPVISWAHGTTGLAADCAPSRDEANGPDHSYLVLSEKMLDAWVACGYAVVQTDYEGLGAPGVHPYLIGVSEARGVVDMVRAARQVEPRIGTRYAISGHSQGGQGALFAAAIAQAWAPELTPVGDVALAPASHVLPYVQGLMKTPTPTLLGQGTADTVVGPIATDLLGKQLCEGGVPVSYRVYDGATHRGLLDASLADTEAWIDARFARSEAMSNCGSLPHAAKAP